LVIARFGDEPKFKVTLEEVKSGDWGIGGKTLTTDAVKQLRASR